jgi:hypothetical protein
MNKTTLAIIALVLMTATTVVGIYAFAAPGSKCQM